MVFFELMNIESGNNMYLAATLSLCIRIAQVCGFQTFSLTVFGAQTPVSMSVA